ncbi:MAG: HypC/HybG/HupF family hydrogenase formation chaperone [Phycisphaerae bacterium]|nr:HypC/HybG/HupF family hydrogenase formation chaperone [Phycisphaerae bacterium]
MCLAVPAQVIECTGDEAVVDLQGSTLKVSKILTPEVNRGDWVLVHAGFAITQLDEAEARETWDYLQQVLGEPMIEAEGGPGMVADEDHTT